MNKNQTKDDANLFPSLTQLNQEMNQVENEMMQNAMQLGTQIPAVNTKETDNEYEVDVAVPGMDKKDLHVEVNDGLLNISCTSEHQKTENSKGFQRQEYSYSQFQRTMAIPENCEASKIQANYQDGVLKIKAPKVSSPQDNNFKKNFPVQ